MKESKAVYVTTHKIRRDQKIVYQLYEDRRRLSSRVSSDQKNNFGCQCDDRDNLICTCRKNVVKIKRRREMRYHSDIPKLTYACHGSRSFTDVGIGSVKEIRKRKVKKAYSPETDERGVGSSELGSFIREGFIGKRGHKKPSIYSFHKRTSSKCIGGEHKIACFINEKLSPITQTKSETTSPELTNTEIGSNTIEKVHKTIGTQFENEKEEKIEKKEDNMDRNVEVTEKTEEKVEVPPKAIGKVTSNHKAETSTKSFIGAVKKSEEHKNKRDIEKKRKEVDKMYSSDSLVQHVHNLEDPSFDKQSKGSFQDPMENKLEREYRKMFSLKSKDSKPMYERPIPEKSTSALRRRFELLRRGLAKKEDINSPRKNLISKISNQDSLHSHKDASVTSDPPSLLARSFSSNTKKHSPIVASVEPEIHVPIPIPKNEKLAQNSTDSESQNVKGMFKLWGKKFNFEEETANQQTTELPSNSKDEEKKEEPTVTKESKVVKAPKVVKKEPKLIKEQTKKEGKKFFFFKKRPKKPPQPQTYQTKKDVTAGRCEISGLLLPGTVKEEEQGHGEGDITRRTWFKKYVSHTIDSARSVNVRWCNSLYATSSSTLFELMDTVYKNYGVVLRSRSETTTEGSSFYKSYTKHKVNFLQDIEAWMIPKTIPDRSKLITIKPKTNKELAKSQVAKEKVAISVSDQKWYIDKSEAFAHNIEIVLHSKNTEAKVSSQYLRIDIPKDFFDTSSSEVSKRNHSSEREEVFKVIEYETNSETRKKNNLRNQPSNSFKVIVSVQDNKSNESKILETVNDRTPMQRDVLIQGSNVNIPKRCDVIGVGIITQRDILREIRKPILKIQDDLSDEDEEESRTQNPHKKCEFAESYLQDYYRNWTRSGADLPGIYSWCASESQLRSSSEKSSQSFNNQGDGTKSCPNIYEEFQTAPLSSSSHYGEDKPCDCYIFKKKEKKEKKEKAPSPHPPQSHPENPDAEVNPLTRVLPKDSLEVFKKRKLYAQSNKSQWTLGCDKPVSCPSKESKREQMAEPQEERKCCKRVTMPYSEHGNVDGYTETDGLQTPSHCECGQSCEECKQSGSSIDKHATINPNAVGVIYQPPCEEECEKMVDAPCNIPNAPLCNIKYVEAPDMTPKRSHESEIRRVESTNLPCQVGACPAGLPCNKKIMEEIKRTKKPASSPGCPTKSCEPPPCHPPPNASSCARPSPCPFPPCIEHLRDNPQMSPKQTLQCKTTTVCDPCNKNTHASKKTPRKVLCTSSCCNPNKRASSRQKTTCESKICSPSNTKSCASKKPSSLVVPDSDKPAAPNIPSSILRLSPRASPCKPSPCPPCKKPSLCHIPASRQATPQRNRSPKSSQPQSPKHCRTCNSPGKASQRKKSPLHNTCKSSQTSSSSSSPKASPPHSPTRNQTCNTPAMVPQTTSPPCNTRISPQPTSSHSQSGCLRPCYPSCSDCVPFTCDTTCPGHLPFIKSSPRSGSPQDPCLPRTPTPTLATQPPGCKTCRPKPPPKTPPPDPCLSPLPSHPKQKNQRKNQMCSPISPGQCQIDPTVCRSPQRPQPSCSNQSLPETPCSSSEVSNQTSGISLNIRPVPKKQKSPKPKYCNTQPCANLKKNPRPKCNESQEYPWPTKNQVSNPPSAKCSQTSIPNYSLKAKCKKACSQNQSNNNLHYSKSRNNSPCATNSTQRRIGLPGAPKPTISGLYLKIKPSVKPKTKETCGLKCSSWNNSNTNRDIKLDELERIQLKIKSPTVSTEEIREGLNIRVQDADGLTLYERRDYGCGRNKPILLEEVYTGSSYNTGPVVFTNVTETQVDQELLEEKSETSLASLIEIQLKLRIAQGNNKTTELNFENDDDERQLVKTEHNRQSQIYVAKKDGKNKQVNANNDMSIKIVVRNFKQKPQTSDYNKNNEEFSKKISDKFHTVSTGYTDDVIAGPDDANAFSIHRATINLSSSIDKSSKSKISVADTIPSKECKNHDEAIEKVSSHSNKQLLTEDENIEEKSILSKKDSQSKIEETITEGTKSELPDFNDTDEQDATLLAVTSNEGILDQPTPKEHKKALLKRVFQRAHKTQGKDKATVRQLRNMLKIILTDSSDNNDLNNSTSELVNDVTYTSLKPNYFRDTDSMNNYYQIESTLSKECEFKESSIMNTDRSGESNNLSESVESEAICQGCMCSKVAEKLNECKLDLSCCCKNKPKQDEETNCDLRNDEDLFLFNYNVEYVDVETQKSEHLSSKANSFNISVHSKQVSAKMLDDFTLEQVKTTMERVSSVCRHESYVEEYYQSLSQAMNSENKVFFVNRQDMKANQRLKKTKFEPADVLQSYETKKAVLEIYAEENGEHYVAKLPKFVYERESEITNNHEQIATNSYKTVCKKNIVMMSLRG